VISTHAGKLQGEILGSRGTQSAQGSFCARSIGACWIHLRWSQARRRSTYESWVWTRFANGYAESSSTKPAAPQNHARVSDGGIYRPFRGFEQGPRNREVLDCEGRGCSATWRSTLRRKLGEHFEQHPFFACAWWSFSRRARGPLEAHLAPPPSPRGLRKPDIGRSAAFITITQRRTCTCTVPCVRTARSQLCHGCWQLSTTGRVCSRCGSCWSKITMAAFAA